MKSGFMGEGGRGKERGRVLELSLQKEVAKQPPPSDCVWMDGAFRERNKEIKDHVNWGKAGGNRKRGAEEVKLWNTV